MSLNMIRDYDNINYIIIYKREVGVKRYGQRTKAWQKHTIELRKNR